jgi:NAD(P)-dependent dehydrogenase (short-subunit alcohol dehydrogenase family)
LSRGELFLVSGGSGGIGSAICDALADRGHIPVVGYCQSREKADSIARRTGGYSVLLDMASPESIMSTGKALASRKENLAGVILAGSPPPILTPFARISQHDLAHQFQVNVLGPQLLLADLVQNCFRKVKNGTIVGILTKAMGDGIGTSSAGMGGYVIGKYGMKGLLAVLAADYPWLRVHSVSPGYTETPMLNAFDDRFLELQRAQIKFSTPGEIAADIMEAIFDHERRVL